MRMMEDIGKKCFLHHQWPSIIINNKRQIMVMPSHGNIWSNQNALPATQNILTPKLFCIQYVLFKHLVLSASISTITVLDIFEASILLSYTFIYYYCSILFSTTPPPYPPYSPFLLGTIRSQAATNSLKLNMLSAGPALAAAKAFGQIPSLPWEEAATRRCVGCFFWGNL